MTAPYALPDLPYDYGALEPHISGEIMELHHSKHHAKYVAGANSALEQMAEARDAGEFAGVNLLQRNLACNLSGHVNHTLFWQNLSPNGGDKPDGELGAAIDEAFGSFEGLRSHFSAAASAVQGSGWAVLAWEPAGARLAAVMDVPPRVIDPARVKQARAGIGGGEHVVRRWAARFDLLSDPNRLRLLMAIHAAPDICVSDLAAATGMTDTAVSQALRLLRSHDWVTNRREGRVVFYALDDHTVHDMLHTLGAGHAAGTS